MTRPPTDTRKVRIYAGQDEWRVCWPDDGAVNHNRGFSTFEEADRFAHSLGLTVELRCTPGHHHKHW